MLPHSPANPGFFCAQPSPPTSLGTAWGAAAARLDRRMLRDQKNSSGRITR
jgi:hypothetical protein